MILKRNENHFFLYFYLSAENTISNFSLLFDCRIFLVRGNYQKLKTFIELLYKCWNNNESNEDRALRRELERKRGKKFRERKRDWHEYSMREIDRVIAWNSERYRMRETDEEKDIYLKATTDPGTKSVSWICPLWFPWTRQEVASASGTFSCTSTFHPLRTSSVFSSEATAPQSLV